MAKVLVLGKSINIQFFANWDDVVTQNAQAFEGSNLGDSYKAISTKLGELGYDVLINNKKQAEFIPAGRLNEVAGQRDQFKTQVEDLNKQLQTMKDSSKGNEDLQKQLQTLMDQNNGLLKDLEKTKVNTQLIVAAPDAINPQDLLVFVNYDNIKMNAKGEVMGAEAEIARLRTDKPYLFNSEKKKSKGGTDPNDDKGDKSTGGMNAMIRQAAGRTFGS